jgi:hypothetical protein
MFNLIETQEALKGLRLPDVMKYANGSSPEVPAYLALSELQRRKSLEDTQAAFNTQQPTVKEQIESGLTSLPQGQVNPAQAQQTVNPTTAPQLALSPTAAPPMVNPTAAPAGVQQGAAPVMAAHGGLMMAGGGLSQLPLPHMFRQSSYADGGIVHFAEPTSATVGAQAIEQIGSELDATKARLNNLKPPGLASRVDPTAIEKYNAEKAALQQEYDTINGRYISAIESAGLNKPAQMRLNQNMRPMPVASPVVQELIGNQKAISPVFDPSVFDREDANAGAAINKVQPNKVPANPNKQASNARSGLIKPPVDDYLGLPPAASVNPLLNPEQFRPKADLTDEQLYKREKDLQRLAGVEENPMKDIKDRYAKLEKKREKQEAQDPFDSLMARLAAIGQAKATDGFFGGLADSAVVGQKFDKEQQALRDRQSTEMNALQLSMAKEDDARKRGDATAVKTERAAQEASKQKLLELGINASMASSAEVNAASNKMNAETNKAELPIKREQVRVALIAAGKPHAPTNIEAFAALYAKSPEVARLYLGQGKTGTMTYEEALKFVAGLPKNMGLTDTQLREKATEYYQYAAGQNAPPAFKEGDKDKSNSGKPIIFKNGKWEYQ